MGQFFDDRKYSSAQSVLEYAILLAIVSAALLTMAIYVRRSIQGGLYNIEDRVVGRMNASPAATYYVPPI